jgi:hypothetical protein
MAELADALALGASAARHAGSSPVPRTTILQNSQRVNPVLASHTGITIVRDVAKKQT